MESFCCQCDLPWITVALSTIWVGLDLAPNRKWRWKKVPLILKKHKEFLGRGVETQRMFFCPWTIANLRSSFDKREFHYQGGTFSHLGVCQVYWNFEDPNNPKHMQKKWSNMGKHCWCGTSRNVGNVKVRLVSKNSVQRRNISAPRENWHVRSKRNSLVDGLFHPLVLDVTNPHSPKKRCHSGETDPPEVQHQNEDSLGNPSSSGSIRWSLRGVDSASSFRAWFAKYCANTFCKSISAKGSFPWSTKWSGTRSGLCVKSDHFRK